MPQARRRLTFAQLHIHRHWNALGSPGSSFLSFIERIALLLHQLATISSSCALVILMLLHPRQQA